ncbi:hypothetical protein ACFQGT_09895 [Natrialbaceae archaeon GCM10025810]|uniref:hypothetical protein n=1 Tax=Halovalidus salilacus TaxID=3075124 RepID=UPI0036071546
MSDEEYISPAEIAENVRTIHESLDLLKAWSLDTAEWLEEEQQRLEAEGEAEYADELTDLMLYVNTVFLRIEYGDVSIRPDPDEDEEEGGDE